MADLESRAERRLDGLETKLAYQERAIAELSDALYSHERRLERLENLFREMAGKLKEVAGEGLPPLPANERPPHY
ncbi:MAG: SlyX family protein [Spirochaetaceae bacterium]|nr:SlyX family protein [Spirochaetaceae bacterium]